MLVWAACTGTNCALWVQPCGALLGRNIDREDEGQALSACCSLLYRALEKSYVGKVNDQKF